MSNIIESIERAQLRDGIPRFKAGDTVRVHFQVIEGQRRRVQVFEGIVIKRQGSGVRETFTVRKQSFGVGVERTFPLHSPKIERIEVMAIGDVRRAKLYYLREKVGKKARCGRSSSVPVRRSHRVVEVTEPATEDAPAATEADDLEPETGLSPAAEATGAMDEEGSVERTTRLPWTNPAGRDHQLAPPRLAPADFVTPGARLRAERLPPTGGGRRQRYPRPVPISTGQRLLRFDRRSAPASWPAPTRRGGARWQGRSSSPASCSTTSGCATIASGRSRR